MAMKNWLRGKVAVIALTMVSNGEIVAQQESSITVKVLYDNYTAEN